MTDEQAELAIGARAPGVMLSRVSGPFDSLLRRGVVRRAEGDVIDLFLDPVEIAEGGMVTISMRVPVHCTACTSTSICARCDGTGTVDDLFSAWLAVRPGVVENTVLTPSAWLPGMIRRVYFRVRLRPPGFL